MRKPNYELTPKKDLSLSHYRLDQRNGWWKMKLWWLSLFPWAWQIASSSRLFFVWYFSWSLLPLFWETWGWSLSFGWFLDSTAPWPFFLSYLSLVDVCSSSVIGPKMLTDIFVETKAISFFGCGQCVVTVSSWLPWQRLACGLLYTLIMSQWVCGQLVVTPYTVGLISTVIHTTFTFHMPYCGSKINHFFCDLLPVLSLACADTRVNEVLLFILARAPGVPNSWIILVSYI